MRKNSRIEKLFDTLFEKAEVTFEMLQHPAGFLKYGRDDFLEIKDAKERVLQKQAAKRMKERKIAKIRKKGDKIQFQLLKNGRIHALRKLIIEKEALLPHNVVCLVSFDIPEDVNRVRKALRRLLKEANFVKQHRSVWATKRDVCQEVCLLVKLLNAEEWIDVHEANKLI